MSLYEVLKASKTERFPDYWTLLWGRKMSASMIKTITGVLPLTFTTKGGTANDWTIYGNGEPGENQFGFLANDFITSEIIAGAAKGCVLTGLIPNENYTMTTNAPRQNIGANIWFGGGSTESDGVWNGQPRTKSADSTGQIIVYMRTSEIENLYGNYWFMVTKGSTAPDHYIPYQQGVGERTENLWNKDDLENGAIDTTTGQDIGGSTFLRTAGYIELEIGESYYMTAPDGGVRIFEYAADKSYIGSYIHNRAKSLDQGANTKYIRSAAIGTYFPDSLMLVKGSTAPAEYVPYGYEIPILCKHSVVGEIKAGYYDTSGFQPVVNVIRATTEPKYLSSGSYKVNIPSFVNAALLKRIVDEKEASASFISGDSLNIKTAGTYTVQINTNDPMSNVQLQELDRVMLLAAGNDYTFYIGDSPLTAGQSISKTSTGVDIAAQVGSNTISTTLYNKPVMEIKYK